MQYHLVSSSSINAFNREISDYSEKGFTVSHFKANITTNATTQYVALMEKDEYSK